MNISKKDITDEKKSQFKKIKKHGEKSYKHCCRVIDLIDSTNFIILNSHDFILPDETKVSFRNIVSMYKNFRNRYYELENFLGEYEILLKKDKLKTKKEQIKEMQHLVSLGVPKTKICYQFSISFPTLQNYLSLAEELLEKTEDV
jgi:hypothetical protein